MNAHTDTLPVHLFKESFGAFTSLLNEHGVKYQMRAVRMGMPAASGGVIEILQVVGDAAIWGSLAAVIMAFIKSRNGRKVSVTTKEGTVIQAEGLSAKELEKLLEQAQSMMAIDTNKASASPPSDN